MLSVTNANSLIKYSNDLLIFFKEGLHEIWNINGTLINPTIALYLKLYNQSYNLATLQPYLTTLQPHRKCLEKIPLNEIKQYYLNH
uniref:Uncharacterized protein n=1 Tax=Onchocerca volvulus TaxID=6282 RepID=A0A8R1TIQ9_ONCVO